MVFLGVFCWGWGCYLFLQIRPIPGAVAYTIYELDFSKARMRPVSYNKDDAFYTHRFTINTGLYSRP